MRRDWLACPDVYTRLLKATIQTYKDLRFHLILRLEPESSIGERRLDHTVIEKGLNNVRVLTKG